jgi:hypothetical protein
LRQRPRQRLLEPSQLRTKLSDVRLLHHRISILTALLLMAILGMAIVIARLWREVAPLRVEVRQLRDETGRLSIDDATKLHAVEVRTGEPLLWKWRVWVPEGRTALVRTRWGKIPSMEVPAASGSLHLKPGEHWITLRAHPSASGNTWSAMLESENNGVGMGIQEADRWWQWPTTNSTADGVNFRTTVAGEPNSVFILKRHRVSPVIGSGKPLDPNAYTSGFVVWLEEQ